jgi:SAM-dependent methyltransferase
MTTGTEFAVLQSQEEIDAARVRLEELGLLERATGAESAVHAVKRVLRVPDPKAQRRPDPRKSWDVLRTVEEIQASLSLNDPILDVGSYASAIPPALTTLGYRRLSGIDLDERVLETKHDLPVDYVVGDLTNTEWPADRFAAITAISVIEHGVDEDRLFAELSRLLRPGGAFLFSTDYWPEKIDTSDMRLFGLPWTIFSAEEMERFIAHAGQYGLRPVSDPAPALQQAGERPIDFAGRQYTFLHGALVKDALDPS